MNRGIYGGHFVGMGHRQLVLLAVVALELQEHDLGPPLVKRLVHPLRDAIPPGLFPRRDDPTLQ